MMMMMMVRVFEMLTRAEFWRKKNLHSFFLLEFPCQFVSGFSQQ